MSQDLSSLPLEILSEVAKFMSFPDYLQLMLVNRDWFHMLNSDELWRGRLQNLSKHFSLYKHKLNTSSSLEQQPKTNIREHLMKMFHHTREIIDQEYNLKIPFKMKKLDTIWSSFGGELEKFEQFCDEFSLDNHKTLLSSSDNSIRCVFLGSGAVGKTTLCYHVHLIDRRELLEDIFAGWPPSMYDECVTERKKYNISLVDTPGQEEYDRLRPICFTKPRKCDMFIMTYPISSPKRMFECLQDLSEKFLKEIQPYLEYSTSVLFVGTKSDICDYDKTYSCGHGQYWHRYVLEKYNQFGRELSQNILAAGYSSTSSIMFLGLRELEDLIVKTFVYSKLCSFHPKKKCILC